MPQVLVPIIAAIGTAVGGVVGAGLIMYAGAIATGVLLLGSLALSQAQKRKAEKAARAQFDAAQVDRLTNMPGTVTQRVLALGRVREGGTVTFRDSSGAFKSSFSMILVLAAHEIDAVEQIYFNDVPVSLDGNGDVTTFPYGRYSRTNGTETVTASPTTLAHTPLLDGRAPVLIKPNPEAQAEGTANFVTVEYSLAGDVLTITDFEPGVEYTFSYEYNVFSSVANIRWKLGDPAQQADSRLKSLFPGVWTDYHQGIGIAYLIGEFQYDETAFPSGLVNVTALIRGAKIYDPRTLTTAWSENPAIMMRHVALHPQFGKRSSISATEDARIIAAANACDATIAYDGNNLVPTYRAATIVPFGATAREVFDDLAQAMGGQWAYAQGEIFVRAGVYQSPVLALTDADLAVVQRTNDGSVSQNPITISTHRARNEKVNSVVARIWDQAANYVMTPISPMKIQAYITADGAELTQEVTMPAVFFNYQAFHVSGIMLRDSRDPLTVTLPFKLRAYPIELFDTVTLTLSRYGWSAKEFIVLGRTFFPDGYVLLTLKETAAAIYQWSSGFVPSGFADNTNLPQPWDIVAPSVTSVTSLEADLIVQSDGTVINAVRVTWNPIQDASVRTHASGVEIQYQVLPETTWRSVVVSGSETSVLIPGIKDNAYAVFRARSRNSVAVSDWGFQVTIQVNGKAAKPPNLTSLTIAGTVLSWTLPGRVPDLAGFVFRFHYGNNLDWNSAAPLHTGVITQSPYDLITRPGGVVTIMGKALDTSGNYSESSANIVMSLGDPLIANVVEQWDFDALSWPYSAADSSGWTIVAGQPSADSLDSFYGTDDQSFYGDDATASFYEPSAYGQMVYVTEEIIINSALAGSIMTLVVEATGTDMLIEYRLSGPGSFYSTDASPFYEDDADPFYAAAGSWQPWPGQIVAARDGYQFRVTIGAGPTRGILNEMFLTIDAPDIEETISDLAISASGTTIPYTKSFTSIKAITATLQANGSGAETVETDKTLPLAPVIRAFNSAHTAVSGATADLVIKGY